MHEAKQHRFNSWVTLTYDDDHLPSKFNTGKTHPKLHSTIYGGTLRKQHVQRFIRETRRALNRQNELLHLRTVRYYYSGEYGDRYERPHYHACLFGLDFGDKKEHDKTRDGFKLYTSAMLTKLWPHGQSILADLTWETAAYTARYVMKKITGKQQNHHYQRIDTDTGEIVNLEPEFNDMSRKPGIGYTWYEKNVKSVYMEERAAVRIRNRLTAPPRYYDKLLQREQPEKYDKLKRRRFLENLKNYANHSPARLTAEEIITNQKIRYLKQKL